MEKVSINKYIIEFIKKNILLFLTYIVLLCVYPLQKVVLPRLYGKSISVINNKNMFIKSLKNVLLFFIVIQILYSVNYIVQGILIPKFTEYSTLNIFKSVIKSYNYDYDNVETGQILAKLIKIQNVLIGYFDSLRTFIFSQFVILGGALIQYYFVSKKLSYYFIIIILVIFLLQYITFKHSLKYDINREVNKDKIYSHCEDVFNNLISVFICKQQENENNLLTKRFKPYTYAFLKANQISFFYRLLYSFFNICVFVFINYYILKLYLNKKISKELFISTFIVTFSLLTVISESYYGIKKFMENYAQVKDLEEYFNNKISEQNRLSNQKNNYNFSNGTIEFQNVFYNYEISFLEKDNKNISFLEKDNKNIQGNIQENKFALNNVSIKINKGEKVAFVGSIGSGKSTCAKLLLKLLPSKIGKISINNVDINDISIISLRNSIFYIPQNPKLLNRSLYENITYGLPQNYNYENRIYSVLNSFSINELNQVFKEKMYKSVGVNGNKLSGGQRQIVWLLRAFLRNSEVIILDEPTASLDPKSKKIVFDFVKFIGKNKTIIVITHDNIDNEFRKIYFNDGKIIN